MCRVYDIKNKKQEEQYVSVLEKNVKRDKPIPIFGFESFRFVGNINKILPLIREKRQEVKEFLKSLQISDKNGPVEIDAEDIDTDYLGA